MNEEAFLKDLAKPELTGDEKAEQRKQLSRFINHLLLHDFQQLVQLLYRIDVNEETLKATLKAHPTEDAGDLIADLILQRQAEKQAIRNNQCFSTNASDEERW